MQVKRIFLFIPLLVLLPSFFVAAAYILITRLGLDSSAPISLAVFYILSGTSSFLLYWWLARGLKSKPFQHGLIVYITSSFLVTGFLSIVTGHVYLSPSVGFDVVLSGAVMLIAMKIGYRNEDVSSAVS